MVESMVGSGVVRVCHGSQAWSQAVDFVQVRFAVAVKTFSHLMYSIKKQVL
jgi:hypothetical protein